MTERMQFLLLGMGTLILGAVILARYKHLSHRGAEQMKSSVFAKWFKFNYTEEYYRGLYIFSGVTLILSGLVFLVKVMEGQPGTILFSLEGYLESACIIAVFGGGLAFIIYSNWKFRDKSK